MRARSVDGAGVVVNAHREGRIVRRVFSGSGGERLAGGGGLAGRHGAQLPAISSTSREPG